MVRNSNQSRAFGKIAFTIWLKWSVTSCVYLNICVKQKSGHIAEIKISNFYSRSNSYPILHQSFRLGFNWRSFNGKFIGCLRKASIHSFNGSRFHWNSQTYSADIYFDQMWQDHRLTFPYTTNNYRVLDIKWLDHIWHPDAFIRNAKSIQFQEVSVPNHYLRLYTNNTFIYGMKLTLHLSCAMNFALYPHDTQKCKIQIQSCKWWPIYIFT